MGLTGSRPQGGEGLGVKGKVQLCAHPVSRDPQPPHGPRQERKQEASQNRPGACSSAASLCSHHLAKPGPEERRGRGEPDCLSALSQAGAHHSPSTSPCQAFCSSSGDSYGTSGDKDCCHVKNEETEAQRGQVTCPRPHSWQAAELRGAETSAALSPQP